MTELAALLLTCDLVNPNHERKEKNIKRDYEKEKWKERGQTGSSEK